ncbi:hypothetical protein [Azospirillum halopraeferens]|uniref:hypothetical protein n=1 Tax=Azospirillum halopraeferens TaxID=34010 RepID=UPI0012EB391D|nr:hypothetical protein [Azospirillum halopraeferens]
MTEHPHTLPPQGSAAPSVGRDGDDPAPLRTLEVQSRCLAAAALARGIPLSVVRAARSPSHPVRQWLRLAIGDRVYAYRVGMLLRAPDGAPWRHVNGAAAAITTNKARTKAILAAAGVPVPAGAVFDAGDLSGALAHAAAAGCAQCVKPNNGMKGIMVFPGLTDAAAVRTAFERAGSRFARILVEDSVEGEVIRFFLAGARAVAVSLNRPANVTGDGAATIARLIEAKNRERAVRALPDHLPIIVDDDLLGHLAGQGLSLASVPAAGMRVLLRATSNGATGADSIACPGDTHPSYAAVAETACRAIPGLVVAAVDMVVADRGRPAAPDNHRVLEINSSPGVVLYHYPWEGEAQDVSGAILDHLIALPPCPTDTTGRP